MGNNCGNERTNQLQIIRGGRRAKLRVRGSMRLWKRCRVGTGSDNKLAQRKRSPLPLDEAQRKGDPASEEVRRD